MAYKRHSRRKPHGQQSRYPMQVEQSKSLDHDQTKTKMVCQLFTHTEQYIKRHLRIVWIAGNPIESRDPDQNGEYALKVEDLTNE